MSKVQESEWLVYKYAANGGLVFQRVADAVYDEALHGALSEAKTWGEFRRLLPEGEWETIQDLLIDWGGYDEDDPERERWELDETPFSPHSIPGFSDGDYPTWAQQSLDEVLPEDLLLTFGTRASSVHNGPFWLVPHDAAEPLVAAPRARGYQVEAATFLRGW